MTQTAEIVIREDLGAPWASGIMGRLKGLGYKARLASDPANLAACLHDPEGGIRAVVVNGSLPWNDLDTCLEMAAPAIEEGRVTGLAVGAVPDERVRERLRDAGFHLGVWTPCDDRVLRFQVNRAFLASRASGRGRRELRAPVDWRVDVRTPGRRKEAWLYDLSGGGAFLELDRPSLAGARVEVELPLAGETPRRLPGTVVHTNVTGNLRRTKLPLGMGVRFDELDATTRHQLNRLISEQSSRLMV